MNNNQKERWLKHWRDPNLWFWSRVDQSAGPDGCWPYTGARLPAGYGRLRKNYKYIGAHRLALALHQGIELPEERSVYACHKCDNPPCCNPSHLFWGTATDNVQDAWAKGRKSAPHSRKIDYSAALAMREAGKSYSQIASVFGVNQMSVARAIKRALSARKPHDHHTD